MLQKRDKLRPDWPVTSYADLTFFSPVFPFVLLFAGGHGGFYGNATGNYTLESNFTGISDEAEGVNRVIEQYIGAYAINTFGKTQKVFSYNI